MNIHAWLDYFKSESSARRLAALYGYGPTHPETERARRRYAKLVEDFASFFGAEDSQEVQLFSTPGRSEIAGNHTDHQRGKVLACSLNLDAIAVVRKTDDGIITVLSEGYPKISVKRPWKWPSWWSVTPRLKSTPRSTQDH